MKGGEQHMIKLMYLRSATKKELEELRQCMIDHTDDMGEVVDELNEDDWNHLNRPSIALVVDHPAAADITAGEYDKVLLALWDATHYLLFGWTEGELHALPPDKEFVAEYFSQ